MATPAQVSAARHNIANACQRLDYVLDLLRRDGDTDDSQIRAALNGLNEQLQNLRDASGATL